MPGTQDSVVVELATQDSVVVDLATQDSVVVEFKPILHHFIDAGFRLVISDATFMSVVMAGTALITMVLIIVDQFNRRGRGN